MINSSELPTHYSRLIKAKALELGFSACGISRAEPLKDEIVRLEKSLNSGYNGEMQYLKKNFDKRSNPVNVLEGAKSVISLIINYYTPDKQNENSFYKVSRYAYGEDYHNVIKEKLVKLEDFIKEIYTEVKTKSFVDASPLLEKALAVKSGLGCIGKQSLLINKDFGTFCFIGEIVLDKDLEYDIPFTQDLCGKCTKCIDACPTKAIVEPHVIDARKCITYLNIENRKEKASSELQTKNFYNWIYGCDICQDVCPLNKNPKPTIIKEFQSNPELLSMTKEDWENITEEKFNSLFQNSAAKRIGYELLKRNIKMNKEIL